MQGIRQGIFLALVFFATLASNFPLHSEAAEIPHAVALDVYKSPTCGCCKLWIDHVQSAGMHARPLHPEDMNSIKQQYKIDPRYQSCHTAVSKENFIFEGHVPARYIKQFLASPPKDALGLAVPGMPVGSPGMEIENRFTPYQVLLLKKDGSSSVFAAVASPSDQ